MKDGNGEREADEAQHLNQGPHLYQFNHLFSLKFFTLLINTSAPQRFYVIRALHERRMSYPVSSRYTTLLLNYTPCCRPAAKEKEAVTARLQAIYERVDLRYRGRDYRAQRCATSDDQRQNNFHRRYYR